MKQESTTPNIDECFEMMCEKFKWDFTNGLHPREITTECKVGNILTHFFVPLQEQSPTIENLFTEGEADIIELACNEIATLCGR